MHQKKMQCSEKIANFLDAKDTSGEIGPVVNSFSGIC